MGQAQALGVVNKQKFGFQPVRGGFEPPVRFYPYNGLANRRIRPLCHRTFI